MFHLNSYNEYINKQRIKKWHLLNKKRKFEDYRNKINIEYTFHSQLRAIERLGLKAELCINDIINNIHNLYQGIENKGICLIKGNIANYILSFEGICITILTRQMKSEGFSKCRYGGKYFNKKFN